MPDIIERHRGVLPHFQAANQIISLNWRLAFTLPQQLISILQELHELSTAFDEDLQRDGAREAYRKDYAVKMQMYDDYLGKNTLGEIDLCAPALATIIISALNYYDGTLYDLHAWCLMPNHLHLMLHPREREPGVFEKVSEIVRKIKTYTAREINKILGRTGALWQHEYYDRYIRDWADYQRCVSYYLNNPVKAGLVEQPMDWKYSWHCEQM